MCLKEKFIDSTIFEQRLLFEVWALSNLEETLNWLLKTVLVMMLIQDNSDCAGGGHLVYQLIYCRLQPHCATMQCIKNAMHDSQSLYKCCNTKCCGYARVLAISTCTIV